MLTTRTTLLSAASVAILALPVLAGTPKALTMVPGDSELVVVMPNVGQLLTDMDRMNAMMGDMGKTEITMATSMVRGMPGINLQGSAAIVLDLEDDMQSEPDAVVLLPITSFDDLTQGRTAVNGLVEMPMGNDPIYFRDIGNGYAAMSNDTGILGSFSPADHTIEQAQAMLGTAGNRVAGANDIMVYMNLDALRPMLEDSFTELEEQADMVEMMGGPQAAQGFDSFVNAYKTAVKDGHAVVGGMSFDAESGFAFDFGLQFTDGSDTAGYFNNNGNAGSFLNKVPAMDFFYAQAFDLSGEGIQRMFSGYAEMMEGMDTSGMVAGMDIKNLLAQFQGGAQVMGASEVMGGGGLLGNTVIYSEGESPEECLNSIRKMYQQIGNVQEQGVSVQMSFADEPEMINGIKAYEHSVAMDMSQMGGGGFGPANPAMMMQMMYGPTGGPAGYAAEAGNGMIYTFSKDESLLTKAYNAASGKNTLMSNNGIAAASKLLPDNRIMEAYVGSDHTLNTVGPMLMMFGVVPEFEPMNALTPVAFGATADGGGMLVRTVIPMQTVQAVMEMVPPEMLGGVGGDDWDDEDDDSMDF